MASANALQKPLTPSAELAAVIGPGPHTRAEATSKLWSYIKDNGCQNPENRREIVADTKLQAVSEALPKQRCSRCPSISTGISRERRSAQGSAGRRLEPTQTTQTANASLLNAGVPDCTSRVTARPLVVAQTIAFYLDLLIPQMVTAGEPLPLPIRREANNTRECLDLLRHSLREERLR